ncbi:uncharacterized protein [Procambarus clarkii]|uniref:uncharacterized protein n=1 Tax=Procambarus clarkii TaxID=6728 RepID=UPI001E675216|nr:uncharacterized protein LOC123767261 [Procambarus clarkii]
MGGASLGLSILALCLMAVAAAEEPQQKERPQPVVAAAATNHELPAELNDRERFIFGRYSTTTYTDVVMVTSTVYFSCLSGTSPAVCLGRRKKKNLRRFMEINKREGKDEDIPDVLLDSSQGDSSKKEETDPASQDAPPSEPATDSKFFVNVWTTSRTTTTVTMLYTDTNTTIRLSYFCQAGQAQLPTFRCVG